VRVCAYPDCSTLVDHGYCPEHTAHGAAQAKAATANADPPRARDPRSLKPAPEQQPTATDRGYDARWRATRKRYLVVHKRCERCGQPATHVHHKDELGPLGPNGHAWSNLEALCGTCHKGHHADETGWGTTAGRR
jgi:5-methylcytosine-specific restriction protein A